LGGSVERSGFSGGLGDHRAHAPKKIAQRKRRGLSRTPVALGIQSPEVVGRALKRWREGFIERALAEDTHLGLPIALVQPLKELMALIEEDLMTARTARDQALKRAEAADQDQAARITV
jgi:hypothetical protein